MTLSTIALHLDHTERCEVRTLLAVRLARQHGSHLLGIVPTGVPVGAMVALPQAAQTAALVAAASLNQRRRAEAIAHVFRCRLRDTGSPSCEIRLVDGDPVDAVIAHGHGSDLVVVGQPDRQAAVDARARQLPEEVMLHAGRPVLIVPCAGRLDGAADRVLVAWDGGREAALSVYGALPLLRKASRVTVVSLLADGTTESAASPCPGDLSSWLLRHGIQADVERCAAAGETGDALQARASALAADLIVMGGYGHARARERILGGVTHDVLARTPIPVLMAH
ncbi:universal stress protein [Variovorax sp. Root434]|uniref:universal stress protein n=1 Tax=Variovorax sp. Root434 TaxID=1736536 RepID=UPI0006FDF497|nr:universal stress protein [Variovorax sp. Root434]KQX21463.1 universal stress protein UspA [Variovorax sp. Root434]